MAKFKFKNSNFLESIGIKFESDHSKAHKLLYIQNISDLPDGELTCSPFVTYLISRQIIARITY